MLPNYLCVQTFILAVIRGKLTPRFVAERLGVTEEKVLRWRDTFLAAGTLALDDMIRGYQVRKMAYQSTCIPDDPTTTTTTTTESPIDGPSVEPMSARRGRPVVIQTTEDAYSTTTEDPMRSESGRGGRGRGQQRPRSGR